METSGSSEGAISAGLIDPGKNVLKRFRSLTKLGHQKFSGARQVVDEIRQEVFLRTKLRCGTHADICVTEIGEQ